MKIKTKFTTKKPNTNLFSWRKMINNPGIYCVDDLSKERLVVLGDKTVLYVNGDYAERAIAHLWTKYSFRKVNESANVNFF